MVLADWILKSRGRLNTAAIHDVRFQNFVAANGQGSTTDLKPLGARTYMTPGFSEAKFLRFMSCATSRATIWVLTAAIVS